ncbi:hypothetical protein QNH39_10090 [Neobacillus novalis]|uniref:Uncharacterized protein n=1 Tax=Neobacillus novalis TaxID=220687 RepID=A0AA95MUX8_9BACI|nr:hypothetical protein [Neobacillus novalis]WHY88163.1 hypothetical protein QNH39_10090 [Neobacillus novalis]
MPTDKAGLVAQLEGSIVIDRTKGEVSVHCDNEWAKIKHYYVGNLKPFY